MDEGRQAGAGMVDGTLGYEALAARDVVIAGVDRVEGLPGDIRVIARLRVAGLELLRGKRRTGRVCVHWMPVHRPAVVLDEDLHAAALRRCGGSGGFLEAVLD